MSLPMIAPGDALAPEVLSHLERQIASAQRLLDLVLRQSAQVRARDVEGVLATLAEIQAEVERRSRLEEERTGLLTRAARRLGVTAAEVTLERVQSLMEPGAAAQAAAMSAELRGLLTEVQREHRTARALMRQELAFLDHLTRMLGAEGEPAYTSAGARAGGPAPATHRVLDLRA